MKETEVERVDNKADAIAKSAASEVKVEIREDLNDIVKLARFENVKTRFGTRHPFFVTFFNDKKVEFEDTDGVYDLLMSYKDCGMENYVKSKALVEEVKLNDEGVAEKTYICMKYELEDGSVYRLFTKKFSSNTIIDNYYKFYKTQQKAKK